MPHFIIPPDSPLVEAQEFVSGTSRHGFRRIARIVPSRIVRPDSEGRLLQVAPKEGGGELRRRAFATGCDPLPAFSYPPPRFTGWEKR